MVNDHKVRGTRQRLDVDARWLQELRIRLAHILGPGINACRFLNELLELWRKQERWEQSGAPLTQIAQQALVVRFRRHESMPEELAHERQQRRDQQARRQLASELRKLYDEHGKTRPASDALLRADADRNNPTYSYSRRLGSNLEMSGDTHHPHTSAHHIVARKDQNAAKSRDLLFGWGIGINDADNGVFLPATRKTFVREIADATKHAVVHTRKYHGAVHATLSEARKEHAVANVDNRKPAQWWGRQALKQIKSELLNDTFPYRPED